MLQQAECPPHRTLTHTLHFSGEGSARFEEPLREHRVAQAEVRALRRASRAYGTLRRTIGMPREIWIEARMALDRRSVAFSFGASRRG